MDWRPTQQQTRAVREAVSAAWKAHRMLPTVDADDMRQACLIAMWQRPTHATRLLCRGAIADELRRCGGRNGSRLHVAGYGHGEGAEQAARDSAESHVRAMQAVRALESLTPAEQRIIGAIVEHGGKTEAARALRISQPRVSFVLRRARAVLADVLDHA